MRGVKGEWDRANWSKIWRRKRREEGGREGGK